MATLWSTVSCKHTFSFLIIILMHTHPHDWPRPPCGSSDLRVLFALLEWHLSLLSPLCWRSVMSFKSWELKPEPWHTHTLTGTHTRTWGLIKHLVLLALRFWCRWSILSIPNVMEEKAFLRLFFFGFYVAVLLWCFFFFLPYIFVVLFCQRTLTQAGANWFWSAMRELEVVVVEVLRVFIKQTAEGLWRPHWGLELEWGRGWKRCTS